MRTGTLLPTLLLALALTLTACDNAEPDPTPPPPPPSTTGTLTGTISLPPGTAGSTSNTRVALYQNVIDYADDRFVYQIGADGSGGYTIPNIVPGTYYMDAWKDNNNNGAFDGGDFYGVYGSITAGGTPNLTPIPIAAGQTVTVSFAIIQLPAAFQVPKELPAEAE